MDNEIEGLKQLQEKFEEFGYQLLKFKSATMGSGEACFQKGNDIIEIQKDRGYWNIESDRKGVESLGLFKAYLDTSEFCKDIERYIKTTRRG
jgi:hypothetical protein